MLQIKLAIATVPLIVILMFSGCRNINWKNSISSSPDEVVLYFANTGLSVKNHQNRIYNLVKDKNGWIYYCSDINMFGVYCIRKLCTVM